MKTLIQDGIESALNKLGCYTKASWEVSLNITPEGDKNYIIRQPNGITIDANSSKEVVNILGDCLEVVKTGDTDWCLI